VAFLSTSQHPTSQHSCFPVLGKMAGPLRLYPLRWLALSIVNSLSFDYIPSRRSNLHDMLNGGSCLVAMVVPAGAALRIVCLVYKAHGTYPSVSRVVIKISRARGLT